MGLYRDLFRGGYELDDEGDVVGFLDVDEMSGWDMLVDRVRNFFDGDGFRLTSEVLDDEAEIFEDEGDENIHRMIEDGFFDYLDDEEGGVGLDGFEPDEDDDGVLVDDEGWQIDENGERIPEDEWR